jgi:ACR3 family arsenite efflux pump ArsB
VFRYSGFADEKFTYLISVLHMRPIRPTHTIVLVLIAIRVKQIISHFLHIIRLMLDLNQGTGLTPKHLGLIDRPFVPP